MSTNHEWANGRRGNHRTGCERLKSQNQANVGKTWRHCISSNNASIVLIFGPQAAPELPFRLLRAQLHSLQACPASIKPSRKPNHPDFIKFSVLYPLHDGFERSWSLHVDHTSSCWEIFINVDFELEMMVLNANRGRSAEQIPLEITTAKYQNHDFSTTRGMINVQTSGSLKPII